MRPSFLRVHATIGERIIFEGVQPRGYYQRLGVTARDEADLTAIVGQFVLEDTGGEILELDAFEVADLEGIHRELADVCGDASSPGVWYASGRGFYGDEVAEENGEEND